MLGNGEMYFFEKSAIKGGCRTAKSKQNSIVTMMFGEFHYGAINGQSSDETSFLF
ncbi:hypothetical protein NIES970_08840 [[Synechococcus] sp. NIES-970]|nr:hypothetical protein NIES970_08840 [[Synechococcus] sp. NIES-970]